MDKRAILFGMNEYHNVDERKKLPATQNDITLMKEKLCSMYFDVEAYVDYTSIQMCDALKKFAITAPCDSLNIVYFSGHGGHLKNENYILPVDFIDVNGASSNRALSISKIPKLFERHVYLIIIIDACRAPLIKGCENFIEMAVPIDTFIAYSSQFDTYSHCEKVSYFTKALCNYIDIPNLTVEEIFKKTTSKLNQDYGKQVSNCLSGLGEAKLIFNEKYIYDEITQKVYKFVEDNADEYKKYDMTYGENLAFIDAAEKYNIPVIDAIYKYSTYLRLKAHQFTSLTENQEKMNIQRYMENNGLRKSSNEQWYYKDRKINWGGVSEIPISMQPISPILGKEIPIHIIAKFNEGKIYIKSNIPTGIILYGNIDQKFEIDFVVIENGNATITIPAYITEPKLLYLKSTVIEVADVDLEVVGRHARNLTGPLVKFNNISCNVIDCTIPIF